MSTAAAQTREALTKLLSAGRAYSTRELLVETGVRLGDLQVALRALQAAGEVLRFKEPPKRKQGSDRRHGRGHRYILNPLSPSRMAAARFPRLHPAK